MVTTTALPWYERGPDGTATGRDWATEAQAHAEAGLKCTAHQETSARVGAPSFRTTRYTQTERATTTVRPRWQPRGFGGKD